MTPHDPTQIIRQLEATCGCTNAARTAAEAMRQLLEDHETLVAALDRANHLLAELTHSAWIEGDYTAAADMRQRVRNTHGIAADALRKVGAL